jgi:cytochrome P450
VVSILTLYYNQEITTNKVDFSKPIKMYRALSLFGPNIVASEFDEWKRHRHIVARSFSEKNNRLVYEETTRIVTELFQFWSVNGDGEVVKVENVVDVTSDLALMVISAAGELHMIGFSYTSAVHPGLLLGFGSRFGWDDTREAPAGHAMVRYTIYILCHC